MSVHGLLAKILLIISGVFFLSGIGFATAAGTDKPLYSVTVSVDKTDSSAAIAREKSILEAEQLAYKTVFNRITTSDYKDKLPKLDVQSLKHLVEDIGIKGEKTSSVRYIGTITITLKEKLVKDLLNNEGIPYVNTVSQPILLIPLIKKEQGYVFDATHPAVALWNAKAPNRTVVPIVMPDNEDWRKDLIPDLISGAVSSDEVKKTFKTNTIYIVEISPNSKADKIHFTLTDIDNTSKHLLKFTVSANAGNNKAYNAAFDTIVSNLENVFKSQHLVELSSASYIPVTFPISTIADWQEVKKSLGKVAVIDHFEMQSISGNDVKFTIYFTGGLTRLIREMKSVGLILTSDPDGEKWFLTKKFKFNNQRDVKPSVTSPKVDNYHVNIKDDMDISDLSEITSSDNSATESMND